MKHLLVLLTVALSATACGSTTEVSSAGSSSSRLECEDSPDAVVELLQQGLPAYDYQPAANLAELIDRVDLVVAGTLGGAARVDNPKDFEASTRIEVAEVVVLAASSAQSEDDFAADRAFGTDAIWADRANPDPLAERVEFDPERTRFVAFLYGDNVGRFRVDVQGLHIGCADGPLLPVLEPLPAGTSARSADELTAAIQAIAS